MIHIAVDHPICRARGFGLTLSQLVRFHPVTYWLMRLFGCRRCGDILRDALADGRPIR